MAGSEVLQYKYNRLCMEFNKLRKKHCEYKDQTSKELSALQESSREKDRRVCQLERECENLRSNNAYLSKQLRQVHEGTPWAEVHSNGTSSYTCIPRTAGDETKSSEADVNDASPPTFSSNRCSDCWFHSASPDAQPSLQHRDLGCTLHTFTLALREWTDAVLSGVQKPDHSEARTVLVKRIGQLEYEVAELSVQLQLERKRRDMDKGVVGVQSTSSYRPLTGDFEDGSSESATVSVPVANQGMLIDFLRKRVALLSDEAQYSSSITTVLQDEIRLVSHHLICLTREAHHAMSQLALSRSTVKHLEIELESTRSNMLKQINEMAKHVANLTDELQTLRSSNSTQSLNAVTTPTSVGPKKNIMFGVLKR